MGLVRTSKNLYCKKRLGLRQVLNAAGRPLAFLTGNEARVHLLHSARLLYRAYWFAIIYGYYILPFVYMSSTYCCFAKVSWATVNSCFTPVDEVPP